MGERKRDLCFVGMKVMMVEIEKEIKKVAGHHKASKVGRTCFFPLPSLESPREHQNLFQDITHLHLEG